MTETQTERQNEGKKQIPNLDSTLAHLQRIGGGTNYMCTIAKSVEARGLQLIKEVKREHTEAGGNEAYLNEYATRSLHLSPFAAFDVCSLYEANGFSDLERAMKYEAGVNWIKTAVRMYKTRGGIFEASRCAERAGLLELAVECYEKAESFETAAHKAEEFGFIERAINNWLNAGEYRKAAETAERHGNTKRAIEIWLQSTKISIFSKGYYEPRQAYANMGIIARKQGWADKAMNYFEKAERYDDAAKEAEKAGLMKDALRLYKKAGLGWYTDAAKAAKQLGKHRTAKRLLRKLMKYHERIGQKGYENNLRYAKQVRDEAKSMG